VTAVPTDIAIAQAAKLRPVAEIAAELGLSDDEVELYGKYKAKVSLTALGRRKPKGRLVLVTGINPTPAGEGKSTVTVGVTQALRRLGKNAVVCIREPSLGPVFGVKGGACGGGYAQVVPMEDINLHFTGDFHAIASAHNLLSAMLDSHLHHGNTLGIDTRRITWPRTIDMNDRALRNIIVGLGGINAGPAREDRFVIIPGSEIMAIMALATGLADLEQRLARIIVGLTPARQPVRASDLKAPGAMTLLLKDAVNPNLVQTLEGGPAFIHCGPFGNIAHGCNSVVATKLALALCDVVLTEAGFGADLGAEKFFDIKCRMAGLNPEAAVVVATVRALKMHGGVKKDQLAKPDVEAARRGSANVRRHIRNVKKFGVPVVVALNRFLTDTEAELEAVRAECAAEGVGVEPSARPCSGCSSSGARNSSRCTTRNVPSVRRSRPSRRRSTGRPASRSPPRPSGRSSSSRGWVWERRRCAWRRPSIRSATTPRSSARPVATRSRCGTSCPPRGLDSWWRSRARS